MSRSKIDEMRSMVRRAEKAEAKLTKREIENIENGRRAREVLKIIETRTDSVISAIAEAYSVAPSSEVDAMLSAFVADLRGLIDENSSSEEVVEKPKRVRKPVKKEENVVQNALEVAEPGEMIPEESIEDFQVEFEQSQVDNTPVPGTFSQPNNGYQTGGIRYDVQ